MTVGTAAQIPRQRTIELFALRSGARSLVATGAYLLLLAAFVALAAQAAFLIRDSHQVHHGTLATMEEWRGTPRLTLGLNGPARLFQPLQIPGPGFPGIRPTGTEAKFNLPYRPEGYVLLFGAVEGDGHGPATIKVTLDDQPFREIQLVPPPDGEGFGRIHIEEMRLPASLLQRDGEGSLMRLLTVSGESWEGNLSLVPNPAKFDTLRIAIPVIGGLLLAGAAWSMRRRPRWWIFPLIPIVLFVVYGYTFFPWAVAPTNGLLFADSWDYAAAALGWKGTSYVERHPLFLPIVRDMVIVLHRTRFGEVTVPQMAFAMIGAGNGLMAFFCLWRWFRNARTAAVLLLVYVFTFSIWGFSAVYETYLFSTAMLNLFLLVLPDWQRPASAKRELATGGALLLASLAFPPLLAFLGLLSARLVSFLRHFRRQAIAPALGLVLTIVGYGVVQAALKTHFAIEAAESGAGVENVLQSNLGVILRYGSTSHMTPDNLANIVLGQFFYAIGGQPYPFEFGQGLVGVLGFLQSVWGAAFLLGWLAVLAGAGYGLLRNRRLSSHVVAAAVFTGGPYFAFLWFLNPSEMLLYSAHMVLPALLVIGLAWRSWAPAKRVRLVFAALAVLVIANNLLALGSYV